MADRVLDKRLQQEARHLGVEQVIVHVHAHGHAVLEPRRFDREIVVEERQLFAERDQRPRRMGQRGAQQVAELPHQPPRGLRTRPRCRR